MKNGPDLIKRMLVTALLLLPFALGAQQAATLRGRVSDASGNALHYATVAAVSLDPVRGAVTDEKGRYTLSLPADSAVRLSVRYSGFATIDTLVTVTAGTRQIGRAHV